MGFYGKEKRSWLNRQGLFFLTFGKTVGGPVMNVTKI